MINRNINCSKIAVDCVVNDPVDIKAGGPYYLGFDFYVKEEETTEMINYIKEVLNENNIPLINIYNEYKTLYPMEKVWTKEKINRCILKDKDYLISESQRNYKRIL